ncbi:cadherin-like domain-containing protein, partial [Alsobacter sp. R-9]
MIKVKATQKPAETGVGRSSFETGVEKASSLPAAFAMALVGLAIYLKGIVSSRAPAPAEEGPKAGAVEPEAAAAPSDEAPVVRAIIERTEDEELVDDRAAGPDGDVIHLTSHAGFRARLMESFLPDPAPAIAMPPLPEAPAKPLSKVALEGDTIAFNDNARLSAALGGGGGGAGSVQPSGGGGGGGSSSTPGERPEEHRRNRAPLVTGPVLLRDVKGCQAVFIPWAALLAGAVDPDGDLLRVLQVRASQGEVTVGSDGITYTPPEHGTGAVTLSFVVSDGEFQVAQQARFALVEADPIVGTDGSDSLVGTACGDLMDGAAGDDTIAGLGGADLILGGDGDDAIDAGAGNDTVLAGAGDDLVRAGAGDDLVWGGDGDDTLMGEAGNDVLLGEAGNDRLEGGDGDDQLFGGAGHDVLAGDAGRDVLDGGEGDDRLDGGAGRDVLEGGAGSDSVAGGAGDDLVVGDLDAAADVLDGGEGRDVLDYGAAAQALDIDLAAGRATGL